MWNGIGWYGFIGPTTSTTDIGLANPLSCSIFSSLVPCISSLYPEPYQGFSLALAIRHSPKIVPDVREFAVQFGQFVRDDFRKRMLYG